MHSRLLTGLRFKIASSPEREAAFALRRTVYARDWPNVRTEAIIDAADETAHHLVALSPGRGVIAALRIVTANRRPFDMERFISIDGLLPADRNPAEIGRLTIAHGSRFVRRRPFVHLGMLKAAIDFSREMGITDLLLTAIPRLRTFYRQGCFTDVGVQFTHETWGLVHVMRLDIMNLFQPSGTEPGLIATFLIGKQEEIDI